MMITVDLSKRRIGEEVCAIQDAARKLPAGRKSALDFLKRIGADGWPDSPTRGNGSERSVPLRFDAELRGEHRARSLSRRDIRQ